MPELPPLSLELQQLQTDVQAMPPVAAMGVQVLALTARGLCLRAPLAANVNDKGNAFGGSLTSLMTLASWAWLRLQLHADGGRGDIYVGDSQVRYLAPVYEDLLAWAGPAQDGQADAAAGASAFLDTFRQRGKARITMQAQVVLRSGDVAARLEGRFVALAKR